MLYEYFSLLTGSLLICNYMFYIMPSYKSTNQLADFSHACYSYNLLSLSVNTTTHNASACVCTCLIDML